ncbi:hypothetical protein FGO68_gene5308 [Halteria grandinella]|uniref:Uncharacterized protein n=1 Tax=Halteria grandinella TaxID=5974 RepID=A0A8J8NN17_HALGN|nr:hypothetical protein FGO68_gene5308 [Halteria grandinella]
MIFLLSQQSALKIFSLAFLMYSALTTCIQCSIGKAGTLSHNSLAIVYPQSIVTAAPNTAPATAPAGPPISPRIIPIIKAASPTYSGLAGLFVVTFLQLPSFLGPFYCLYNASFYIQESLSYLNLALYGLTLSKASTILLFYSFLSFAVTFYSAQSVLTIMHSMPISLHSSIAACILLFCYPSGTRFPLVKTPTTLSLTLCPYYPSNSAMVLLITYGKESDWVIMNLHCQLFSLCICKSCSSLIQSLAYLPLVSSVPIVSCSIKFTPGKVMASLI